MDMPKKKKKPRAKLPKAPRKVSVPQDDPEWDSLESRFDTTGYDWAGLAKMVK